ncbi:MAG: hypothetical protein Ct9H300mP27_01430 [Chloroflexota bacterium]|nr:MAG: hypothetical protein Ct9H300mP27_01430 [Chloroflexota bacterium]
MNRLLDIKRLLHRARYIRSKGLKSAVTSQVSFVLELAIGALLIPIAILGLGKVV